MAFQSAKEMNTKVAKRIKAAYERSTQKKYQQMRKRQVKDRQKAKKAGTPPPHVDSNEMPGGVLAKDSRYAYRGPEYVKANSGGAGGDQRGTVYDRVANRPHLATIAKIAKRATFYDPAVPKNFDASYTQSFPYVWEAHHMLPGSAFYYETASGPVFSSKARGIVLRSDYNINDGHNIIMLPTENWAVPVHELPQHPSDHVRYTQRVMKDMKNVAKDIQKKIDQKKKHDAIAGDVYQQLRDLENLYWEFVVNMGKQAVSKVIAGTAFVDDAKEYVDFGGYKYGRLF